MPPLAKVYEALGAIGDGRVRIEDTHHASVTSSDGAKVYTVETSADGTEISSNDNASFWQGYLGYPAIAMLIVRGLIDADQNAIRRAGRRAMERAQHALSQRLRSHSRGGSAGSARPGLRRRCDSRGGRRGTRGGAQARPPSRSATASAACPTEVTIRDCSETPTD